MSDPLTDQSTELLAPEKIVSTLQKLANRVEKRFPGSGLARACCHLLEIARLSDDRSRWLGEPMYGLRIGLALLIIVIVIVAGGATITSVVRLRADTLDVIEFVQVLEAGINDLIMICAGLFFVWTLELWIKRKRIMSHIRQLPAIAHVIDMHQLTKDPEKLLSTSEAAHKADKNKMNAVELGRYLDYCSEMLSLTGKVAAVYVQQFPDHVALAFVNEIESLTTGLSRKIWQKIMILHSADRKNAA